MDTTLSMEISKKENTKKVPAQWTIITALDYVLEQVEGSKLSDEFWKTCNRPLRFLRSSLGLTDIQIVILAILVEAGEPMSWRKLGE